MLTQEDLEQIGKVIDGRLGPIKQDIQGLKDGQVKLAQKIDRVEQMVSQDVEILGEFIVKITEYMDDHAARIKRLEKHTGLSHS